MIVVEYFRLKCVSLNKCDLFKYEYFVPIQHIAICIPITSKSSSKQRDGLPDERTDACMMAKKYFFAYLFASSANVNLK